jgi:tRNA nucleotidyltransferase/poly(A) polymerase
VRGLPATLAEPLERLARGRPGLWLVGGAVRDALLGRPVNDLDIAVSAGSARSAGQALADAAGGALVVLAGAQLVRVILPGGTVDFTPLRAPTIEADLAARDFTVNAMAVRLPAGATPPILDPTGGRADLHRRVLRACGDRTFQDDPVRLWRALRLPGDLRFRLEPGTAARARRDARLAAECGAERLRDEIVKLLSRDRVAPVLRTAAAWRLLDATFPEVARLRRVRIPGLRGTLDVLDHTLEALEHLDGLLKRVALHYREDASEIRAHLAAEPVPGRPRVVLLRLALLFHDLAKADTGRRDQRGVVHFLEHEHLGAQAAARILRDRLRCAGDEIEIVTRIIRNHLRPGYLAAARFVTDRAMYRLLRDAGAETFELLLHAQADQMATHHRRGVSARRQRAVALRLLALRRQMRERVPARRLLTGHDVMRAFRLRPGPDVGVALRAAEEAVALGRARTRAQALAAARRALDQLARRMVE